jgi:hypothetical protein
MQSSLWKLLTAAGIIGIGTLVVLEVQNRLPVRNGTQQGASVQVTGHDSTVTPDGLTELDRALASAGTEVDPSDPSLFDNPATGFGNPAPPAGDERFYGAMEDQTIRKDELTDDGNPF